MQLSIEEMQLKRLRIYERLNKNAPGEAGADLQIPINKSGGIMSHKIAISLDNVNPTMMSALSPHLDIPKITMSTTDVKYVEFLASQGRIEEAKSVLANLKSVAKNINSQIIDVESYLVSMEV